MIGPQGVFLMILSVAHAKQCYDCNSLSGSCTIDGDSPGQLVTCPEDRAAGCFIDQMLTGEDEHLKVVVAKGCTGEHNPDGFKCSTNGVGSHEMTFCNCEADGCNKGWTTAAGPPVKCYQCDSTQGTCSDTDYGTLEECPLQERQGCFISRATYGTDTAYERGCTAVTNPAEYVCQDIGKENQGLHYCNCHGDGCNQNWSTAGANTVLASLAALAIALLM